MMKKALKKMFDYTLGALWRLYVRIIVDGIFISDIDLSLADWCFAIVVTALFIVAIPAVVLLLLQLVKLAMSFPLPVMCVIIGIVVICILPWFALKSYRYSKAKAIAAAYAARKPTRKTKKTKKAFNQ